MSGDLADYARYFQVGERVRIEIPLSGGGTFQEWGVVHSLERDLLELDLSRDLLPQQVRMEPGSILKLEILDREGVRCCRGMVADEQGSFRLVLRLLESVVTDEPREFFRQDVYLPLDYRLPPRQHDGEIRERWRQRLWAKEFASQAPDPEESGEIDGLREEILTRLERRKAAMPTAANISGGGVRLNIPERLRTGMLLELTIYLPQPQRVLEMVGEVVQVRPLPEENRFSTALRFCYIDEADRDRLIGYISAQQLSRLSQRAPREADFPAGESDGGRRRLYLALCLSLLVGFFGCQVRAIVAQKQSGEKHEIERVFQEGIENYVRGRR